MARPDQESIDTFISITGLPDTVAIQILQEHGGDLMRAVNAHFSDGSIASAQGTSVVAPQNDFMDLDETVQVDENDSSTNLNLPPLINRDFRGSVFNGASEFTNHAPFVSQPTERRVIPIDVKNENGFPSQSGLPTTVDDVTARSQAHGHGSQPQEAIVIDDEDDETDDVPVSQNVWDVRRTEPSAPVMSNIREADLDIEEEMIRAAIEASKRDAEEIYSSEQLAFQNGSEGRGSQIGISDTQIASSSSEGALLPEQMRHGRAETSSPVDDEFQKPFPQNERLGVESSTLPRQGAMSLPLGSVDSATGAGEVVANPPSSPGPHQHSNTNLPQMQQYENGFPADEWGGISSTEHDEAVMLEAAMFGGIPETSEYNAFSNHRIMQSNLNGNMGSYMVPEPRPPSPNLTAQRQLREQQDDEYLASLRADIEKAEARRLEEEKAIEAAREEQKRKEEESLRKLEEKQELERQLAAKEASIPQEPSSDDANAVNLLVRMPDGSRRGRRFLKSDKLKSLFDYIDVGKSVKPNTYRLVRPYPRRAFSEEDSGLTLSELGLTSKQEALYLELV